MENKNTYLLVFLSHLSVKIIIICDNINNAFSLILQHIFFSKYNYQLPNCLLGLEIVISS